MKYTVLLLRPDYIASQYGEDTYLAHVEAETVVQAMASAQIEAWDADNEGEKDGDSADHCDYNVLFTTEGHLFDLSTGTTSEGETR